MSCNTLCNDALRPTTDVQRNLSFWDYTLLWAGMTINIGGFAVGGQLYPGLSPVSIILAVIVAYSIVSALLVLNGDMGLKYGVPFAIYLRACFGIKGAIIPSVIRAIPCFFWFGFQTWIGALAVQKLMVIWFGTDFTVNLHLLIGLFAILQVWNAVGGLKSMARFAWLAIPLMVIFFSSTIMWLLKTHDSSMTDILSAPAQNTYSFPFAVAGIAGVWITMALNSADLGRMIRRPAGFEKKHFWHRQKLTIGGQFLGLILVGSLVIMVGMVSGILTGEWNPVDVIIKTFHDTSPAIMGAALLTIVFAQWSTNTTANLMPATYIVMALHPTLTFRRATVISAIIGLLICPWLFAEKLIPFQVACSVLLGPIIGIMLADYYLVRRRTIDIDALYDEDNQAAWRLPALLTLLVSAGAGLLTVILIPEQGIGYSFYTAFILSVVMYPLVMRYERQDKGRVKLLNAH
ncbi:cytosine permease [Kistimonas scapharcae]|uniref:Cytosine permease n=1 Tax=Kistimonas scapharcae TaxID=1036133 RepID=A0ABP8V4R1_9GAMM